MVSQAVEKLDFAVRLTFPVILVLLWPYYVLGQSELPSTSLASNNSPANSPTERVIYDPTTGRRYHQRVQSVSVPSTEWKTKQVTQTVYEPQISTRYVTVPQTVYVPRQGYVMRPRVRGLWNPFRQPVTTYDYVPTTQWVATVQNQRVPLTNQNWVAKERTLYVSEPVQKQVQQQQLVTTEIPGGLPATSPNARPNLMYANQPAPRMRIPLLARPPSPLLTYPSTQLAALPSTPSATTGLRPVSPANSGFGSNSYSAPLRTAGRSGIDARDTMQSGMSATILR